MKEINIKKLLKSGNFTIVYWDNGEPTLYKGKWDINKEFDRDEYETMDRAIIPLPYYENGYLPAIVYFLVEALRGKSDTI